MAIPVKLSKKETAFLEMQKKGNLSLRRYNRINILLLLHKAKRTSEKSQGSQRTFSKGSGRLAKDEPEPIL